jgi:hypothetical protein
MNYVLETTASANLRTSESSKRPRARLAMTATKRTFPSTYPRLGSMRSRLALSGFKPDFQPFVLSGNKSAHPVRGHLPSCCLHKHCRYSTVRLVGPRFFTRPFTRSMNHLKGVYSSLRLSARRCSVFPTLGVSLFDCDTEQDLVQKNLSCPFFLRRFISLLSLEKVSPQ